LADPLGHFAAADARNRVARRLSLIPVDLVPTWTAAVLELPDDRGRTYTGSMRDALLLLLTTGLRLREGLELAWAEVDLERGRIEIAEERMKGGHAHMVPIPRRLRDRLRARRAVNPSGAYVFPGPIPAAPLSQISRRTVTAIGARIGHPFTAHDLRRTVATFLGAHAPAYVVRAILSHADPGRSPDVTLGYVNLDVEALRPWLQQWEEVIYG
jgi:integrase